MSHTSGSSLSDFLHALGLAAFWDKLQAMAVAAGWIDDDDDDDRGGGLRRRGMHRDYATIPVRVDQGRGAFLNKR